LAGRSSKEKRIFQFSAYLSLQKHGEVGAGDPFDLRAQRGHRRRRTRSAVRRRHAASGSPEAATRAEPWAQPFELQDQRAQLRRLPEQLKVPVRRAAAGVAINPQFSDGGEISSADITLSHHGRQFRQL
jgi:hypothetical protein